MSIAILEEVTLLSFYFVIHYDEVQKSGKVIIVLKSKKDKNCQNLIISPEMTTLHQDIFLIFLIFFFDFLQNVYDFFE